MNRLSYVLLTGLAAVAVTGCGGSEAHPTLAITSPAAAAEVSLGTDVDKSVPIGVTLTNFMLKAPGECKTTKDCGHLHVNIDGDACNAMGMPYNGAATDTGKVVAKFALCEASKQVGDHKVTISVHDDGHASINNHDGKPLSGDVTFKTK